MLLVSKKDRWIGGFWDPKDRCRGFTLKNHEHLTELLAGDGVTHPITEKKNTHTIETMVSS